MNKRENDLLELKSYTENIDKELTLILQSLQWDRQHLLQAKPLVKCKHDPGHAIPEEIKAKHEEQCYLKKQGYTEEDVLLPDPLDITSSSLVKLSNTDISNIINIAATSDPRLQRGMGCEGPPPLTLGRLQATFTADERRAIHNAVVQAAPACHDLTDLTLPGAEESSTSAPKSRLAILAELRDMKRRRVKYRVASKSRNYSDVLRDVIKSQMELYTEVKSELSIKPEPDMPAPIRIKQEHSRHDYEENDYYEDNYSSRDFRRDSRDASYDRGSRHREQEERHDRRNREIEYSKDRHKSHKERDRNKSRDGDRKRHDTREEKEEHRYDRDKKYDRERDRRKEERHRHDKNKSNGAHSHSEDKVKKEKRKRHYDYKSYDDYEERKRP